MKSQIVDLVENKALLYVGSKRHQLDQKEEMEVIERKRILFEERSAKIMKCQAAINVTEKKEIAHITQLDYLVHYKFFVQQKNHLYVEEQCEERTALFDHSVLERDTLVTPLQMEEETSSLERDAKEEERISYTYNRLKAVQYAELWWNSYNPKYKKLHNDCTNFISQCLHEGGAPMTGYPNRSKGWWMRGSNWSYSWAIANALRWYLSGSKTGLRAREVQSPKELLLGDVICYDFQGDGRFDHNTIVTGKDADGMPLVNAHTYNSRMRYWSYLDSTAYTPNIKYKFFHIIDNG